jgi:hypothetical protein
MKRPELMDASTRRFVEALLSPPPRDNWSRKLKATPLRTRANRSAAFQESPETRVPFINKKWERGAKIETLADDLINLNCGTHSLGLIYEFFAKQFGEATGREEFIKYVSGDWSRNWVQAAAARVAEEQPNWSPPMPAPVRISNEDGANAGISSQRDGCRENSRQAAQQRTRPQALPLEAMILSGREAPYSRQLTQSPRQRAQVAIAAISIPRAVAIPPA